jgi:hypothetical protein
MYTKNNKFKCDYCGRFIAFDDIRDGKAYHHMSLPDSHYSCETWESVCKTCNQIEQERISNAHRFR